ESIAAGAASSGQFTLTGVSPNISWDYSSGCSGGANMQSGSYKVYYTNATGCVSEPVFFCVTGNGGAAMSGTSVVPQVTIPANGLTTATTSASGTGEPNSTVALYVNGTLQQTVTASSAGAFSFTNLSLLSGQQVYITNIVTVTGAPASSKCLATSSTYTVTCNSNPPIINGDGANGLAALQPITGIASKGGDVVRVYATPATLVATTTALADGTWSTGNTGTTPAAYNAVSGTSYFATAQSSTCGISANSATLTALTPTPASRCGTITAPVGPTASGISGTLTGSFNSTTVNLYLDGTLIGTTATTTTAWGPIATNTVDKNTALYPNGLLTIGLTETGKSEMPCPLSATAITCSPLPLAPSITPANSTTTQNGTVTYTVANATAGTFYALSDSSSGESLGTGTWAPSTGSLSLSTKQLSTTKTYTVLMKATSLSGVDMCTSVPGKATIVVSSILPARVLDFRGRQQNNTMILEWKTEDATRLDYFELERSQDGTSFIAIAKKAAQNGRSASYQHADGAPGKGRNFYRLKMVDDDGTFSYSKTLLYHVVEAGGLVVAPNPFETDISVGLKLPFSQPVRIILTGVTGSIFKDISVLGAAGSNSWNIGGLGQLAKGVYLLKLKTRNGIFQQKIMKIN
ncbi:MAG TPA: T9SS type A sorting domain-containing protein, partial [Flavisolibacter sp.]|nr:T9SS type A sorting domain-containing protein [Flavisolibacter sp.]